MVNRLNADFDTVFYKYLETASDRDISDRTNIGCNQHLKYLGLSLYPLSFYLNTPFNSGTTRPSILDVVIKTTNIEMSRRIYKKNHWLTWSDVKTVKQF